MGVQPGTVIDSTPPISPQFAGRLLQTAFLSLFIVGTVIIAAVAPDSVLSPRFITGVALIAVATVPPFLPGFSRWGLQPWAVALPALDFVAIAIIRTEGAGGITNPLILSLALPAIWVGLLRSRGALWAFVPLPLAVIVPDILRLIDGSLDESSAGRASVLVPIFPLLMILAAVIAHIMATTLDGRQTVLDREQEGRLVASAAIEKSRTLLEAVVDSLDVGVVVVTPDHDLILMNRRLRESPELASDGPHPWKSLLDLHAFDIDGVTAIAPGESISNRIARGEEVRDSPLWLGKPGPDQRAVTVSADDVLDADGALTARVIVVKDVTEFVRALEAKDVFIATVSHELRTPLMTIAGFVELIGESADSVGPEVREWLGVIQRNVKRQQLVVRDLLAAASTSHLPLEIDVEHGDLSDIVREAAIAIASEADAKHILLTVRAATTTGLFDPLRFAQIAENLLSNAVRYTAVGGSVSIECRPRSGQLELIVADNGVGIAEHDRERLFDQFFRSATARASTIRGIGLGLSVVRILVTAHDGTIDIESEVGVGTTVTVRIPSGVLGTTAMEAA